ncbi:ArnT family glycosyltransferase [Thiomicrorhabdus sp.]|uniref:ArnT family glycosyltransferase n=1 Tax=Thiomicrorhabdus sp. TaxID=2039724 RepID=UPI002AA6EF63|nr:glycosyltransferase family 39 protein [Thiomicrorhabdus sp.]
MSKNHHVNNANNTYHAFSTFFSELTTHQKWLVTAFVLLKVVLIFMVPLTGDEAYFITWGQHLALGYYDHPPAVGWVLYLLGQISDSLVWYRAFAFVSAIILAYLIYKLIKLAKDTSENTALWVALAFFVSPISLMFVVTANDTVLVLFSMLGLYFFAKALQNQKWVDVLLAGLLLGMAFLSKYFAAFMLIGLILYALWQWKQINFKQLLVMVFIVLLAVAENLYFNATHCWNNILFNFFSRTEASHFEIGNVISYLLMIVLLLSPVGMWYWFKNRKMQSQPKLESQAELTASQFVNPNQLVVFAALPLLLVLLVVSFTNQVGLHWPLISVTALYVLYRTLTVQQLQKLFVINGYFSVLVAVVILVALSLVNQLIKPTQKHHLAVYVQPQNVCEKIAKVQTSPSFFTLGYSSQSTLSYHCGNDNIHVFASTSKYGREDDKLTNFKALNGKNLQILITQDKDLNQVEKFFKRFSITPLKIDDSTTYYWFVGEEFNYDLYREKVLKPVNEKFYTAPDWFPKVKDGCGFKQKYDFE